MVCRGHLPLRSGSTPRIQTLIYNASILLRFGSISDQLMISRLTREIAFYRKYHRDPINVGLHIIGIPTILGTSLYNLTVFRIPGSTNLTLGFFLGLYYFYYYLLLDPKLGSLFGAVIAASSYYFGTLSARNPQYSLTWSLWAVGWIAQFLGHGLFEGKAPALFDNLRQALVLAPYFAVLEVAALLGVPFAVNELHKVDISAAESLK